MVASKSMGAYGHPLSLTKHAFFVMFILDAPNTFGHCHILGYPHPNTQGEAKHREDIQTYRGCPNMWDVQPYRGVSKDRGHPNIWGMSKHTGGYPNIWRCQNIWGHPNIQGCPNIWGYSNIRWHSNIQGVHPNIWQHLNIEVASQHTDGIQAYGGI